MNYLNCSSLSEEQKQSNDVKLDKDIKNQKTEKTPDLKIEKVKNKENHMIKMFKTEFAKFEPDPYVKCKGDKTLTQTKDKDSFKIILGSTFKTKHAFLLLECGLKDKTSNKIQFDSNYFLEIMWNKLIFRVVSFDKYAILDILKHKDLTISPFLTKIHKDEYGKFKPGKADPDDNLKFFVGLGLKTIVDFFVFVSKHGGILMIEKKLKKLSLSIFFSFNKYKKPNYNFDVCQLNIIFLSSVFLNLGLNNENQWNYYGNFSIDLLRIISETMKKHYLLEIYQIIKPLFVLQYIKVQTKSYFVIGIALIFGPFIFQITYSSKENKMVICLKVDFKYKFSKNMILDKE